MDKKSTNLDVVAEEGQHDIGEVEHRFMSVQS
jgi:hypothetical protein